MFQEFFAGEICLGYPFRCEFCHNLSLCGYGGMVCAGNPERILAHHTGATGENILDGVVEHVTHMEHTGHVWWRNHNCIRLTFIRLGMKQTVFHPIFIPFTLHCGRIIFGG